MGFCSEHPPRQASFKGGLAGWAMRAAMAAIIALTVLLLYSFVAAPFLRITPVAAQAWMGELEARIDKRIRVAFRAEEPVPGDDAVSRAFQSSGLPLHHYCTWQAREVRRVLLAPAAVRLQADLLADIAQLARANDHCAPYSCGQISAKGRALTDAQTASITAARRLEAILLTSERSYGPAAVEPAERGAWAAQTPLPCLHEQESFGDVMRYQEALWELVYVHTTLTHEYLRRHRLGRLLLWLRDQLPQWSAMG